jgi:hypothetical protein
MSGCQDFALRGYGQDAHTLGAQINADHSRRRRVCNWYFHPVRILPYLAEKISIPLINQKGCCLTKLEPYCIVFLSNA